MRETNITRRRVLQGAGAVGVASLGSTVISAQEGGGQDGPGAAIRVAHASPDAPNIDVRLNSTGGGAAGGGNETGGNQTDGNLTGGNDTGGNQTNDTGGQDGGGDEAPEITGLGFRQVSSYNEINPGSYRMEIVPAEGGLLEGFIQDLFGGGDEDERTVLFDDEIEVEEGTTYTVVAFGEVAQGPIPAEGAEMDGNETAGNETGENMTAGNETVANETAGNETDGNMTADNETAGNETNATQNETDGAGGDGATAGGDQLVSELAFGEHETVDLEAGDYTLAFRSAGAAGMDDETDGGMVGNETNATQNETDGNETDGNMTADNETAGNETNATTDGGAPAQSGDAGPGFQVQVLEDDITAPGEEQARLRIFHAVPDVESVSISQVSEETPGGDGGGGNDTDGVGDGGAGQQENDTGAEGDGGPPQEEGVRRAEISPAGNTAYSGFALGYFDPQAAATAGDGGNATGNATGGNMTGNATVDGNATGNETGNATSGEEVAEDAQGEEFEFVTVEDAQGGERSDGGTGGLFNLAPSADD